MFGWEAAEAWWEVHEQFHIGEDLGDMSFSQVPLDLMEHIARVAAGHSMGRDIAGLISNEVFALIQQIAGQDALVRMPRHDGFGHRRRPNVIPARVLDYMMWQQPRIEQRLRVGM